MLIVRYKLFLFFHSPTSVHTKLIKILFCRLMQLPEQELDEPNLCQSPFDDLSSGRMGRILSVENLLMLMSLSCFLKQIFFFRAHTASFMAAFPPGVMVSSCMDNGSAQVLHSAILSPVGSFTEARWSSSVPNNLPSPVAVASVGKQFGHLETNRSMDEMKFGNQSIPSLHPHSFPEYNDSLASGIPYNSSSAIGDMAGSFSSKVAEGINSRHIRGVGSNGHLMELNGGGEFR